MIDRYGKAIQEARVKATLEREKIALHAEQAEQEKIKLAKNESSQILETNSRELEKESKVIRKELSGTVDTLAEEIAAKAKNIAPGKRFGTSGVSDAMDSR